VGILAARDSIIGVKKTSLAAESNVRMVKTIIREAQGTAKLRHTP